MSGEDWTLIEMRKAGQISDEAYLYITEQNERIAQLEADNDRLTFHCELLRALLGEAARVMPKNDPV